MSSALAMLEKSHGIAYDDLHGGNIGIDAYGNLRIIDEGGLRGDLKIPSKLNPEWIYNQLPKMYKNDKELAMSVYQQLVNQIEQARQAHKDSMEQRVQEIIQRRQSQASSEKSLDLTQNLDKSDGTEPIKKEPEPILSKPTEEEVNKEQSDLEQELAGLEKEFAADPENQKQLDAMNEDLAKLKKVDKAVQAGAACIVQKAV